MSPSPDVTGLDPSIILAGGNTNDPMKAMSLRELQLRMAGQQQQQAQVAQQVKAQNMLKAMFAQPGAVGPGGVIRPDIVQQVLTQDPDTGLDLLKNQADIARQQAQAQEEHTKHWASVQTLLDPIRATAIQTREDAIKSGASPEQADVAATKVWNEGIDPLKAGGQITPADAQGIPTKYDNPSFTMMSQTWQDHQKQTKKEDLDQKKLDLATKGEEDRTAHGDAMLGAALSRMGQGEADKGWSLKDTVGPDGKPQTVRVNAITGEVKPVDISGGLTNLGSGKAGEAFTPEMSALMASLAEKGVSLPTGFRSKEQQVALYKGILAKNPDKTPDEIADDIKKGKIELAAQTAETTTAAKQAGKVQVAQDEIKRFAPRAMDASLAVPRGDWVPINRLLQTADTALSDPKLKNLKVRINALMNAYDQLASRGGTDVEKRKEARDLLLSADGPEAFKAALDAITDEAELAHEAAVEATKVQELPDADKPKSKPVDHSSLTDDELKKKLGIP